MKVELYYLIYGALSMFYMGAYAHDEDIINWDFRSASWWRAWVLAICGGVIYPSLYPFFKLYEIGVYLYSLSNIKSYYRLFTGKLDTLTDAQKYQWKALYGTLIKKDKKTLKQKHDLYFSKLIINKHNLWNS